jgi:hypothetical protein
MDPGIAGKWIESLLIRERLTIEAYHFQYPKWRNKPEYEY